MSNKESIIKLSQLNDNSTGVIWVGSDFLPHLLISNKGDVYSTIRNRILKTSLSGGRSKYKQISYTKDGINKGISVHRLVCLAFIPNPEQKPFVNHKNGIKTDNRVENLEWCTHSENMRHAHDVLGKIVPQNMRGKFNELHHGSKPVRQFKDGVFIKEYPSIKQAQREGFDEMKISLVCRGKQGKHKGYTWEYVENHRPPS